MHHLIDTKRHPKADTRGVAKATKVPGACFDSIHCEVDHKVDERQPPQANINCTDDDKRQQSMYRAMQSKWRYEAPVRSRLLQHVAILQWKVRNEMFDLKSYNEKQKYPPGR